MSCTDRDSSSSATTVSRQKLLQSAIPVKPDYRRNQFGGTLGGPLATDHTFFYVDYQGSVRRSGER